jgi:aryl-alcohol dehydrogenase-like predicted oxidoreductase
MVVPGRRLEPNRDGRSLSAYKLRTACDASPRRLNTDRIDLYQLHHVDRACPWHEVWQAFETLMAQGKVVYAGSSNLAGWDLASACLVAERRGTLGLVSEQSHYHLLERTLELEVLPAARHFGLGVLPWSPLGGGLLGGALVKAERVRTDDPFLKKVAAVRPQLERYEALCRDQGEEPAAVALAWLLHQPGVTAPVIGPRTMAQLEGAVRGATLALDEATLARLDDLFPGPGGGAPEAYAW